MLWMTSLASFWKKNSKDEPKPDVWPVPLTNKIDRIKKFKQAIFIH